MANSSDARLNKTVGKGNDVDGNNLSGMTRTYSRDSGNRESLARNADSSHVICGPELGDMLCLEDSRSVLCTNWRGVFVGENIGDPVSPFIPPKGGTREPDLKNHHWINYPMLHFLMKETTGISGVGQTKARSKQDIFIENLFWMV